MLPSDTASLVYEVIERDRAIILHVMEGLLNALTSLTSLL